MDSTSNFHSKEAFGMRKNARCCEATVSQSRLNWAVMTPRWNCAVGRPLGKYFDAMDAHVFCPLTTPRILSPPFVFCLPSRVEGAFGMKVAECATHTRSDERTEGAPELLDPMALLFTRDFFWILYNFQHLNLCSLLCSKSVITITSRTPSLNMEEIIYFQVPHKKHDIESDGILEDLSLSREELMACWEGCIVVSMETSKWNH